MKTIAWKIFTSLCLITRKGKYAEFINGISYYPECERKSQLHIIKDQLFFCGNMDL